MTLTPVPLPQPALQQLLNWLWVAVWIKEFGAIVKNDKGLTESSTWVKSGEFGDRRSRECPRHSYKNADSGKNGDALLQYLAPSAYLCSAQTVEDYSCLGEMLLLFLGHAWQPFCMKNIIGSLAAGCGEAASVDLSERHFRPRSVPYICFLEPRRGAAWRVRLSPISEDYEFRLHIYIYISTLPLAV